jgi:hypothetical protein
MITKTEYELLKKRHQEGCKDNDYSKMIMMGDENDKKIKEYEQTFTCKHSSIEEIQGGQIERCRQCGKQWG